MFSTTWGKLPETADLRSLRDLKPWGVLSSAEIAGSWKTRKRGDAVLPKCLLSLERSYSIKQKVSCQCLCLFLWRNKGGFRRRSEMGKGFRTTCFSRNWFSGHWLVKKQKQKQTNSRDTQQTRKIETQRKEGRSRNSDVREINCRLQKATEESQEENSKARG